MHYICFNFSIPKESEEEPTQDKEDADDAASFQIKNPEDYREIFQPRSRLSHSPNRHMEPFQPPPEDGTSQPKKSVSITSSRVTSVKRANSEHVRKSSAERQSPLRKSRSTKSVSDDGRLYSLH